LALSQHYFRDPTHVAPLHPETLSFLMNLDGEFSEINSHLLAEFSEETKLKEVDEDWSMSPRYQHAIRQINNNVSKLNSVLFGHADYAVFGRVA